MNRRNGFLLLIGFCLALTAQAQTKTADVCSYVDPFIGTQEMGHTLPGATVPFGMVQLSPETDTIPYSVNGRYNGEVYRYCAGYQYTDPTIVGFAHTHFSGTGHSDLGDFLIMPTTGELQLNPGTAENPESGYRSRFSHEHESASPGYYQVLLQDYDINAELTTSTHVGMHRYSYPKTDIGHIILDMNYNIYNYDGKVIWASVRVENDTLVTGYRITRGWARNRYLYFAMTFSKPIKNYGMKSDEKLVYKGFWRKFDESKNFPQMESRNMVNFFDFDVSDGQPVEIKFALSAVSTEGALKNLQAEIPGWDFEQVKSKASSDWEKELEKVQVEAAPDKLKAFYTSLYHAFINPITYSDVDGKYRGLDGNIYQADGFTDYTVFSLWDTYRALHPLFTVLQPKRANDMVVSMLKHYEQSVHHLLPVWSHFANENWCMIGYHAVPVIVDAYEKGIRNYDIEKAFEAVVNSSTHKSYDGIGEYMQYGYVPFDKVSNSASLTLEYAYDDWTIAKFAQSLGKTDEASTYLKRALSYQNLFDPSVGFIRAKNADGSWKKDFNALKTTGEGYIEGNAWNYSFYEPQDVAGYIRLMGGEKKFTARLDSLFEMHLPDEFFEESEDIDRVGIVGGYVQGNEPSHHVPYLYAWTSSPWKTAEKIHHIIDTKYNPEPDGLCGNDDCGQMSAWYIFSSIGFYPVCPGTNQYVIGSPCVNQASIEVGDGKTFTMKANKLSEKNIYIQSVTLNGKAWDKTYINHEDLMNGGELVFNMGPKPNKKWGVAADSKPYSISTEDTISTNR
ncbi:GH92 family glycosyl hydrolase [Mangrovibacterium diazotrophicum]|uniref:Putative alpha-1,2-mannosidase n=1 Tax=Mangrovibacterium diazotrophicum TaxID=1261403 RepID=A0A419WAF7_9BACT|nr:GH92 family glycosyl hydrolase [Mangrovibacterium diazotrophicum]RKD92455.1 putative alpha-1,2-mannosidase [Mangrovibacterium diazotrophicum]